MCNKRLVQPNRGPFTKPQNVEPCQGPTEIHPNLPVQVRRLRPPGQRNSFKLAGGSFREPVPEVSIPIPKKQTRCCLFSE